MRIESAVRRVKPFTYVNHPVRPKKVSHEGAKVSAEAFAFPSGGAYFGVMSTITIPMPDEDLAFLRAWSEAQGISPEAFLARQARNLREHLQRPLHPDVVAATGVIAPEKSDEETYRDYLERKHA
jgi:hypothetical protein